MAGATQPQPIVSNTQGTMTDTQGKPVETSGPAPEVKPVAFAEIEGKLNDSNIPAAERKQFAEKFVTDHLKQNPELVQGFRDAQAGKNTPQAQAFQAKFKAAQDAHIQQQVQANPEKASTPQGFGEIVNNAIGQFQNMPPAMQAMVGIGLPMGLIGVMSSLFGGGGMGMGIMGALGLGAGVLGGAAGGMFGQGASNMAGDAMFNMGSFLGMVPEKADLSALKGNDPIGALVNKSGPIGSRADVKAQVEQGQQQAAQLRQLMSLPVGDDVKIRLMQRLDPTIDSTEAGQQALQNANTLLKAYDDPNSALQKKLQEGQNYANSTGISGGIKEYVGVPLLNARNAIGNWINGKQGADMTINKLIEKWAFNDMDAKELSDLKAEKAKGAPYRVDDARREHELNLRSQAEAPKQEEPPMMTKKLVVMCMKSASRCWAGYEPVPGKKPYSNDSCRPVGSGKKKKTDKKKSAK
jgi:hypothetical protein